MNIGRAHCTTMNAPRVGCAALLLILLLSMAGPVLGDQTDGRPVLTSHEASVQPGDTFDLEVTVEAWTNATYTVTFAERTRFTFPGSLSKSHDMTTSDAILFKVPCKVDDDAPDGDFLVEYNVTWSVNGTTHGVPNHLKVVVGEGAGTGQDICSSSVMVVAPAVIAFSLLLVGRKRVE